MQTVVSNNGLVKVKKALSRPKKSILELAKTIPNGRYKGLSDILETYEIPKEGI